MGGEAPVDDRGIDRTDPVKYVRVKCIWIGHGGLAAVGSIFTGILSGNSITHWWVELQTQRGWYCVQFDNREILTITKCANQAAVTASGFKATGINPNEDKNITTKYSSAVTKRVNMGEVANYVRSYAKEEGRYNLIANNCQHFAKNLYDWISVKHYYIYKLPEK